MDTIELEKGFDFRVLTPELQHRAIQYRAEEIYQSRVDRAARQDWSEAFRELSTPENRWPKDEDVRSVAQVKYEKRVTAETEQARESAKLCDWLTAERDLRSKPRWREDFKLPVDEIWGEYKFDDLTPEQQHLAINVAADRSYRWRLVHEEEENWFKAAEKVQETIKNPANHQIKPIAQAIHDARTTEVQRLAGEKEDWLRAKELFKTKRWTPHLPVRLVPQIKPRRTYLGAA